MAFLSEVSLVVVARPLVRQVTDLLLEVPEVLLHRRYVVLHRFPVVHGSGTPQLGTVRVFFFVGLVCRFYYGFLLLKVVQVHPRLSNFSLLFHFYDSELSPCFRIEDVPWNFIEVICTFWLRHPLYVARPLGVSENRFDHDGHSRPIIHLSPSSSTLNV